MTNALTTLFKWSNGFFDAASVLYAFAFLAYAWHLISTRKFVASASSWLGRAAFLAHTTALILRWMDAGVGHPPWTNLYESLVFFSWGVMGAHIFLEIRYAFKLTGVFATATVFAAMGIASLHPNKAIEPLVPALQSWWLLFHVFMACIAYAFFLASSFISVFYLLKDKVSLRVLAGAASLVCLFFLCIAAGKAFFLTSKIEFFKVVVMEGREIIMNFKGPDGKPAQEFISVAGAQYFLWPLLGSYLAAGILFFRNAEKFGKSIFHLALVLHVGLLATVFVAQSGSAELHLKSNPYRMAAMVMTFGISVFFNLLFYTKESLLKRLPDAKTLDRWGYETILIGVPFMTINLISGAVWAYYAWGRYWGWDPKETWALITWMIYLIYLHTRILGGWSGRKTAIISLAGFFVVIFTYLGVNLVISGLHSYATG